MASAPATTRSLLLLRKLKDIGPTHSLARARLAPSLALAAILDHSNKLFLYSLGKDDEDSGLLLGFEQVEVTSFHWAVPRPNTTALVVEARNALYIYHFKQTHFKTVRNVRMQAIEAPEAKGSAISTRVLRLPSFAHPQDDGLDVYCYTLPYEYLEKRLELFDETKTTLGAKELTFRLQDTNNNKNQVILLVNERAVLTLEYSRAALRLASLVLTSVPSPALRYKSHLLLLANRTSPKPLTYVAMQQDWLFVLDKESHLHILNSAGRCRAVINLNDFFGFGSENSSPISFKSVAVAEDLKDVVILGENNNLYTIELDLFFKNNAAETRAFADSVTPSFSFDALRKQILKEKNRSDEDEEDEDDAELEDTPLENFIHGTSLLPAYADLFVDTRDETLKKRALLRWFEDGWDLKTPTKTNSVRLPALETLTPPWAPQGPFKMTGLTSLPPVITLDPHQNFTANVIDSSNNYATRRRQNLALNGFNSKATRQEMAAASAGATSALQSPTVKPTTSGKLKRSHCDRMLPTPFDLHFVDNFVVGPTKIILLARKSSADTNTGLFIVFDRVTGAETSVAIDKPLICLPDPKLAVVYFFNDLGLGVLLPGDTTDEKLTNGLIIFDKPTHADLLFAINGWDRKNLRLHTLSLGLRYRQLDVIEPALGNLEEDQQLKGTKMLLAFIKHNALVIQDEQFWAQLLHIGMNFISGIIKTKSTQVGIEANAFAEIQTFANHLEELRSSKLDITAPKQDATSIFTSPFSVQKAKSRITRERSEDLAGSRKTSQKSLAIELFSGNSQAGLDSSLLGASTSPSPGAGSLPSNLQGDSTERSSPASGGDSQPRAWSSGNDLSSSSFIDSLDATRIEELDEALFSIGGYRDRWEKAKSFEVIGDALVSGNLSLALSYLRWRVRQFGDPYDKHSNLSNIQAVKQVAHSLIYQTVSKSQFSLAKRMISNLGEDIDEHFKAMAWFTSLRNVRQVLLEHLTASGKLSDSEKELIRFSTLLEEQFPNANYGLEYSRLKQSQLNGFSADKMRGKPVRKGSVNLMEAEIDVEDLGAQSPTDPSLLEAVPFHSEFTCSDLQDYVPHDLEFRMDRDRSSAAASTEATSSTPTIGYAWFRMKWLDQWQTMDASLKTRILLESLILKKENWKQHIPLTAESIPYIVAYFSAHNDWNRISDLIQQLFTNSPRISTNAKGEADLIGAKSSPELVALISSISAENSHFPAFVKEIIYKELAQRGVLLPDQTSSQGKLIQRLASSAMLLPTPSPNSTGVDLSQLLPTGEFSPFHYACIQFCIDQKLPSVLQCYLDAFDLARTPEQIQHLLSSGNIQANRSWVRFLLLIRSESTLFDASMANAKITLDIGSKKLISINSMISASAKDKRPFMALASMAYAPVSLREALGAPKDAQWFLDSRQMMDFLAKFPALQETLFPELLLARRQARGQTHANQALIADGTQFDLMTSQHDLNLIFLLEESAAFSLDTVLGAAAALNDPAPAFSSSVFDPERFTDSIDLTYYLTKGEPLRAYHLLLSRQDELLGPRATVSPQFATPTSTPNKFGYGDSKSLNLTLTEMSTVLQTARTAAINQFLDDSVVAACVAFLELCDINSLELRVDIEAARRIFKYKLHTTMQRSSNEALRPKIQQDIAQSFLAFSQSASGPGQSSAYSTIGASVTGKKSRESTIYSSSSSAANRNTIAIAATLAQLEDSTRAFRPAELGIVVSKASDKQPIANASMPLIEGEAEASKWVLVVQFCSVYGLPLTLQPLVELAKRANWVSLLYFAQTNSYPLEQVLEVVSNHIESKAIRGHLTIALKQMIRESTTGIARVIFGPNDEVEDGKKFSEDSANTDEASAAGLRPDLFKILLEAIPKMFPGETMLESALHHKWPLLAVVAQCFPDVNTFKSFAVWLHATLSSTSVGPTDPTAQGSLLGQVTEAKFSVPVDLIGSRNRGDQVTHRTKTRPGLLGSFERLGLHSLATLHSYTVVLVYNGFAAFLQRGLQIFEPSHPLCHWLTFKQAFHQYRFHDAKASLGKFLEAVNSNSPLRIGDTSWALEIAIHLSDLLIAEQMPTAFERREFLKLIAESKLDPKYTLLYSDYLLMTSIGIDGIDEHGFFAMPAPSVIEKELVAKKMFEEGRAFALKYNLSQDEVTLHEARELINITKTRGVWNSYQERGQLWMNCNELFVRLKCHPLLAGEFFHERAQRLANALVQKDLSASPDSNLEELPQTMTVHEAATEHVTLLSLARPWFDGTHNEVVGHWSDLTPDRYQWKEDGFLQDIDAKMLRSSVVAQAEAHNPNKQRLFGVKSETKAPLALNRVDAEVLDTMIGTLLNENNFPEAERISTELNHTSKDLLLVNTMLSIANGSIDVEEIAPDVQQLISAKLGAPVVLTELKAIEALETLARTTQFARECADRIIVRTKVARLFFITFEGIQSKDPYDVLQFLLIEGPDQYTLCKQFIHTNKLNSEKVAQVIGERCFREILDLDSNVSRMQFSRTATPDKTMSPHANRRIERDPSMENLAMSLADQFTRTVSGSSVVPPSWGGNSAMGDNVAMATSFAQIQIPGGSNQPPMSPGGPSSASAIASPAGTPVKRPGENKQRFWSSRYFPEYLDLTTCPAVVGDELQRQLQKTLAVSPTVEVEIIIRTLMAYRRAQDVQRQAKLFALVKDRVPLYVKQKQYRLLVRLVTGTKQYTQLQYVLDILVKADYFDMLLAKNATGDQEEDKRELAVSLYNFLKTKYPTHHDKMKLLFLRFAMYREQADVLQERAWAALNTMKSRLDPTCMLQAMDCFIDAATNYAKDKAFALERKCLDNANLIQLQFELPEVRVVNLKPGEAEQFVLFCPEFSYCRIVANAYNLNSLSEWAESIYHHTVVGGNFAFYEEFAGAIPLDTAELMSKIVKKFKTDQHRNSNYSANIRRLLEYLDDCLARYKAAQELGFTDIMEALGEKVFGLEYFVTQPQPGAATVDFEDVD